MVAAGVEGGGVGQGNADLVFNGTEFQFRKMRRSGEG